MNATKSKREKMFGGGWSQKCVVDGRELWLIVKKGRSLGKRWGNHTFVWHGQVIEIGKVIWSGTVSKGVTAKWMLEQCK